MNYKISIPNVFSLAEYRIFYDVNKQRNGSLLFASYHHPATCVSVSARLLLQGNSVLITKTKILFI